MDIGRIERVPLRDIWSHEALGYNSLVTAWPEISATAHDLPTGPDQTRLFDET